jgi:hypothetical protein
MAAGRTKRKAVAGVRRATKAAVSKQDDQLLESFRKARGMIDAAARDVAGVYRRGAKVQRPR